MPASRKRNKGKERKAKKKEVENGKSYNSWQCWARGKNPNGVVIFPCNHGLAEVPDKSHPVSSYITAFYSTKDSTPLENLISHHQEVWNNDDYRKLAIEMFTRIGSNWICAELDDTLDGIAGGICAAVQAIMFLEKHEESVGINDYIALTKRRNILAKSRAFSDWNSSGIKRDALKFFRKRMDCKCLKKMHLEARKTCPKLGACDYCNVEKERTLLMVCSKCMVTQYCSRKCQVAASPEHREDCDKYVKARQQTMTMANDSS